MTASVGHVLRPEAIVVGATASDKADAIARVGALLVELGYVTPGYVDAMREREAVISTYLGNGISLPHGTSEAQDTILQTGLAVAQFPAGVAWGDEPARLVIGLAAKSDEHIAIMSRLAGVLEDAELCERLGSTSDALEIHQALTSDAAQPRPVTPDPGLADEGRTVRIANPHGLHARPAAQIVERVMELDAEATIVAGDRRANAFSITQLIALGASVGDEVTVSARGPDAAAALDTVLGVLLADEDIS
jgi:phosphocarrier protein FPr